MSHGTTGLREHLAQLHARSDEHRQAAHDAAEAARVALEAESLGRAENGPENGSGAATSPSP